MNKKIISLLLKDETIPMSWGVTEFKCAAEGVAFSVNGFKFKGDVLIVSTNKQCSKFDVAFLKGGDVVEEKNNIKAKNLVKTIDNYVEKTDNYDADRKDWVLDEITKMTGMDARGFKNIMIV